MTAPSRRCVSTLKQGGANWGKAGSNSRMVFMQESQHPRVYARRQRWHNCPLVFQYTNCRRQPCTARRTSSRCNLWATTAAPFKESRGSNKRLRWGLLQSLAFKAFLELVNIAPDADNRLLHDGQTHSAACYNHSAAPEMLKPVVVAGSVQAGSQPLRTNLLAQVTPVHSPCQKEQVTSPAKKVESLDRVSYERSCIHPSHAAWITDRCWEGAHTHLTSMLHLYDGTSAATGV
eukprot:6477970-Amphidinium_carterae.1